MRGGERETACERRRERDGMAVRVDGMGVRGRVDSKGVRVDDKGFRVDGKGVRVEGKGVRGDGMGFKEDGKGSSPTHPRLALEKPSVARRARTCSSATHTNAQQQHARSNPHPPHSPASFSLQKSKAQLNQKGESGGVCVCVMCMMMQRRGGERETACERRRERDGM